MAYEGFKKLKTMLAKKGDVKDPTALASSIGRKKYGKEAYQEHATKGTSMKNVKPKKSYG